MGEAIVRGTLTCGLLKPTSIVVADPLPERRRIFDSLGIAATDSVTSCMKLFYDKHAQSSGPGAILLAVKPQMLSAVANDLGPALRANSTHAPTILSILAGMTVARLHEFLGTHTRIVRAMPNLPARIRQSTTALCRGPSATDHDESLARHLFTAIGPTVVEIDESLMDAFTALAGSGPAYLFYLAEAMTKAAADLGFDPATASHVIRQTLLGAATLLSESSDNPATLRTAVTSKGGTTAAATSVLDNANAMQTWLSAIKAARDRGTELAQTT